MSKLRRTLIRRRVVIDGQRRLRRLDKPPKRGRKFAR